MTIIELNEELTTVRNVLSQPLVVSIILTEADFPSQHQRALLVKVDEFFWITFVKAFPDLSNELITTDWRFLIK